MSERTTRNDRVGLRDRNWFDAAVSGLMALVAAGVLTRLITLWWEPPWTLDQVTVFAAVVAFAAAAFATVLSRWHLGRRGR